MGLRLESRRYQADQTWRRDPDDDQDRYQAGDNQVEDGR